jgi:hypothetical protein
VGGLDAAGDQVGCTDLTITSMPETLGHDMDVPESKFHSVDDLGLSRPCRQYVHPQWP